jgi:hypothetical protein
MNRKEIRRLTLVLAAVLMTTEDPGNDGGDGGGDPGAGGDGGGAGDDLSTLFTAEEIESKKTSIEAAKQEETRRAGLTEEQRVEEDRIKAEQAAADLPPEKYADFKVPDGVVLDPAMVEAFGPVAKELGLNQDKAQKIIDLAAQMQQRTIEGIFAQHEERKASWLTEAKKDPEIGADVSLWDEKDPESAKKSVALRAFNTLAAGAPGIKAMVDELGIGNHPEFIRVMYRLGLNMREDTFELPGGGGEGKPISRANALWPDMN